MEPAMAICAGVAALTLSLGAIRSVGVVGRRLISIRVPIPVRPLAVALVMASLLAAISRPRPATATVAPPIVRLADEPVPDVVDAPVLEQTESDAPAGDVYVVEPGDSLWRIAGRTLARRTGTDPSNAEIARFWPSIFRANQSTIGENPNLIFPGQHLVIPEG